MAAPSWRIIHATCSSSRYASPAKRPVNRLCLSALPGRRVSAVRDAGMSTLGSVRKLWFRLCAAAGVNVGDLGPIFQDTRKPLRLWFRAIWHVTSQKNGVSALGLQRVLGLGSDQTRGPGCTSCGERWSPGRERLAGVVEVDETYWGAEEEGVSGRQTERKALIAVAAEERGRGLGRIRMQRVRNASAASLMPFVEESVELGKRGAHRRLAGLRAAGEEGLPASHRLSVGPPQASLELLPG